MTPGQPNRRLPCLWSGPDIAMLRLAYWNIYCIVSDSKGSEPISQEGLLAAGGDKVAPFAGSPGVQENIKECHRNLLLLP